ncbi:prephenate dehydrogenase [Salinicoccus siamensis]|uniref:Prephenate dehydrogenase n=1 Tax=Salinicoccus siamensis TaxID=381830 RepID=A0ABV5Z331_9STAP
MNIVIVGLGNIGGSFALNLAKHAPEHEVFGIDVDKEALLYAEQQNIISKGYQNPEEIIPKADLIIFSVYPGILKSLIEKYIPYMKENTIITDVTGVKRTLINQIEPLLPATVDFIFGHPMAGRENRGLHFSSAEVFEGANYLLTPTERNHSRNINTIKELVQQMGFKEVSLITPEFHDEVIGFTSQLAHVIALSLINSDDPKRETKRYTGDSYRDLTRITNINEALWPELFVMNKDYLMEHIERFKDQLNHLSDAIENEDFNAMKEMMIEARSRYHDLHN